MKNRTNYILGLILVVFAITFGLISITNHYNLRTYALDYGMFNNAIYDFSEFRNNEFTLGVSNKNMNYFYDHFSPITVLLSPFRWLGTYGLIIAQILSVLLGGIGVFKYAKLKTKENSFLPLIATLYFFVHWGVVNAISFDFHTNVIMAMLIPWLFVAFEKKNWWLFALFLVLTLITKENSGLWLFFIFIGILINSWKSSDKKAKFVLVFSSIFSGIYFYVVTSMVMPSLGEGSKQLFRYSHIGDSYSDIIVNLISNPIESFKYFYENTSTNTNFDFAKMEFHIMSLFAGIFLLILRPGYVVMLIPLYAQKFLSSQLSLWGIDGHYSIEFVPIMTLALIDIFKSIKLIWVANISLLLIVISTSISNYRTINKRSNSWYVYNNINLFKKEHYQSPYNVKLIKEKIKAIPKEKVVSASNPLAPHMAYRDKIYLYPRISDAETIVLLRPLPNEINCYPLKLDEFDNKLNSLTNSGWKITYDEHNLIILENGN